MTVPGQGQEPNPQAGQEPGGAQPNAQPQTPPAAGQEPQQPPAGETFTREYVEQLRQENAAHRTRATAAEAKVTKFERDQLTETERKDAELADAKAKATDLESKYQTALIRAAVDREATKQGAVDPDAVFALMDRSELQVSADGTVTGADKAVAALLKAKTYLVAAEGDSTQTTVRGTGATPRPNGRPGPKDAEDAIYNRMREQSGATRW